MFRRVHFQETLAFGKAVESAQGGDYEVKAFGAEFAGSRPLTRGGRPLAFGLEEGQQVRKRDGRPFAQALRFRPADEPAEQSGVGLLGVRGLSALVAEVLEEILDQILHEVVSRPASSRSRGGLPCSGNRGGNQRSGR